MLQFCCRKTAKRSILMPETLGANKVNTMAQGIDVLEDYLLTADRIQHDGI